MKIRTGEKLGWTLGLIGGFIWVLVLSILFILQAKTLQGLTGLLLFGIAMVVAITLTPWRYPTTRYWQLMVPPMSLMLISFVWALWSFGAFDPSVTMNWWLLSPLCVLFGPFITLGAKTWESGTKPPAPFDQRTP